MNISSYVHCLFASSFISVPPYFLKLRMPKVYGSTQNAGIPLANCEKKLNLMHSRFNFFPVTYYLTCYFNGCFCVSSFRPVVGTASHAHGAPLQVQIQGKCRWVHGRGHCEARTVGQLLLLQ